MRSNVSIRAHRANTRAGVVANRGKNSTWEVAHQTLNRPPTLSWWWATTIVATETQPNCSGLVQRAGTPTCSGCCRLVSRRGLPCLLPTRAPLTRRCNVNGAKSSCPLPAAQFSNFTQGAHEACIRQFNVTACQVGERQPGHTRCDAHPTVMLPWFASSAVQGRGRV